MLPFQATMDDLTLKVLTLSQELLQAKVRLEQFTREGHFLLAKARYSMGSHAVSGLQLPSAEGRDFKANVKVQTQRDAINELDVKHSLFHEVKASEPPKGTTSGAQNRKETAMVEDVTPSKAKLNHDPLRWFGVLTPPVLKQSQSHFQKALELSVECANLQAELIAVMNKLTQSQR